MKRITKIWAIAIFLGVAANATASIVVSAPEEKNASSDNEYKSIQVLVEVDQSTQQAAQILPLRQLPEQVEQFVYDSVKEMHFKIDGIDHQKKVNLLVNFDLQAVPRPDGRFDTKLVYTSSSPIKGQPRYKHDGVYGGKVLDMGIGVHFGLALMHQSSM